MSDEPKSRALARAYARSIQAADEWCANGTLVDAAEVERRRGVAVTVLEPDSLVVVKHHGVNRYVSCVLEVPPTDVSHVNRKLAGLQPWERVLFWLVRHGALRGLTAVEALREGRLERVAEHADAWAAERRPPTCLAPGISVPAERQ